jgi:hypothetical protein
MNNMRYIKLFENFNQTSTWETKLEEIKNNLPTDENIEFSWKIESSSVGGDKQGFLFISLYKNGLHLNLQWNIDLDSSKIQFIAEGQDSKGNSVSELSYNTEVDNIEQALEMVESDIEDCLYADEVEFYEDESDILESLILEKNVAKNQSLWASCKAWAKERYDVWPSAYACGAAAKRYKAKGGKWRKAKKRKKSRK